jgi:altronate dehydratase
MDETIRQKRSKHLKLKQHQEKMPENILRSIKTSSNYVKKTQKKPTKSRKICLKNIKSQENRFSETP